MDFLTQESELVTFIAATAFKFEGLKGEHEVPDITLEYQEKAVYESHCSCKKEDRHIHLFFSDLNMAEFCHKLVRCNRKPLSKNAENIYKVDGRISLL